MQKWADPFRLLPLVAATFPKGTALGGGDKVSGSAIRRPLGGAVERSETEGVASAVAAKFPVKAIKLADVEEGAKNKTHKFRRTCALWQG